MVDVHLLIIKNRFDVFAISETWLDDSIKDSEICPPGYTVFRNDRNRNGGGVAIFVYNRVRFRPRTDLSE